VGVALPGTRRLGSVAAPCYFAAVSALSISGLSKRFAGHAVLEEINLEVAPAELVALVALVGPNGGGDGVVGDTAEDDAAEALHQSAGRRRSPCFLMSVSIVATESLANRLRRHDGCGRPPTPGKNRPVRLA